MKNFLIVLLLSVVGISGCKKDKSKTSSDDTVVDLTHLQGTWYTTSQKTAYFNSSNAQVGEDPITPGIKYIISSDQIKYTYLTNAVDRKAYSVSTVGGKSKITIGVGDTAETYDLISVSEKVMTWTQESPSQKYGSAKMVTTIEFHCPCR